MITKAATIIYTDPIDNIDLGWFAGTQRPMHLQRLDSDPEVARMVFLERDGQRVFEPEVGHRCVVLDGLREYVDRNRLDIERRWVQALVQERRLDLDVAAGRVVVDAYSGESCAFTRTLRIPHATTPRVRVEGATLLINIGEEERPMRAFLPLVLWGDLREDERRRWSA